MSYQVNLIKSKVTGNYHFVGSIPVQLARLNKDGKELNQQQSTNVCQASNPTMISKTRVFKSVKSAIEAAKKYGINEKDIIIS